MSPWHSWIHNNTGWSFGVRWMESGRGGRHAVSTTGECIGWQIYFISRMLSLQLLAATWQRDHQQNGDEPGRHQKIWFADMIPQCDSLSVPHHTDICLMLPYTICEGWLHIGPGQCRTDSATNKLHVSPWGSLHNSASHPRSTSSMLEQLIKGYNSKFEHIIRSSKLNTTFV